MSTKDKWAERYRALSTYGYTDTEIAELAGATRAVVCRVRNGNYEYNHDLNYTGGRQIEARYKYVLANTTEGEPT